MEAIIDLSANLIRLKSVKDERTGVGITGAVVEATVKKSDGTAVQNSGSTFSWPLTLVESTGSDGLPQYTGIITADLIFDRKKRYRLDVDFDGGTPETQRTFQVWCRVYLGEA